MNATLGGISGLVHPDDRTRRTIVPVHGREDLKRGTPHGILKQAKLTEDDSPALL
jgi:predicted RNA binding protein YcfA (HicA-like mRNA interferase family)